MVLSAILFMVKSVSVAPHWDQQQRTPVTKDSSCLESRSVPVRPVDSGQTHHLYARVSTTYVCSKWPFMQFNHAKRDSNHTTNFLFISFHEDFDLWANTQKDLNNWNLYSLPCPLKLNMLTTTLTHADEGRNTYKLSQ